MEEHRKSSRGRVLKAAKIIFNHNACVVDCTVRDLSEGGALLLLPSTLGIPAHFELLISGETSRALCEVTLRKEQRLGVHFAPTSSTNASGDPELARER